MKKLLFAVVFALIGTFPARADDSHEAVESEALQTFTRFANLLASIKDKAAADKAKPELKKTGEKVAELKQRLDKLGEPKGDKKQELAKKFDAKRQEVKTRVETEMKRIFNLPDGADILKTITDAFAANKK